MELPHPRAQMTPSDPQRANSSIAMRSWKLSHSLGATSPGRTVPSGRCFPKAWGSSVTAVYPRSECLLRTCVSLLVR